MCICSFTELKIYKFKSINSFLGFFGSLSSWSILFSVWKMDLEHWNVGLSFVWTLITVLFISKFNPGILRSLNTFDSWIIKIKIIGDLKDIYLICKNKTSVFHYYLVLRGDALLTKYLDCENAATAWPAELDGEHAVHVGQEDGDTKGETKTEAVILVVMSMLHLCLPYVWYLLWIFRHPPDPDRDPDDQRQWGPWVLSCHNSFFLLLEGFFPQNVHPKVVKIVKYNTGTSLVFLGLVRCHLINFVHNLCLKSLTWGQ